MIILYFLIAQAYSLQGLVSMGRAIKVQQQLNYYAKKHGLQFNIQLIDLSEYKDFDETQNLRYTTKCFYCNKTFKNSSYLQMHQYNRHFDANLTETIIYLNYFCEFTNCIKPYNLNNQQGLPTNVRIQKCLKFSQEYMKYSILEIYKCKFISQVVNLFCDDIVKDEDLPFEEESPILDTFVSIFNKIIAIGYIIGSLYIVKKIQEYVRFLQRRHRKKEPKNAREKYTVI